LTNNSASFYYPLTAKIISKAWIKNRSISKMESAYNYLIELDPDFFDKCMHNLPFYIMISYLLSRYGLLFTGTLTDRIREYTVKKKNPKYHIDIESRKNLNAVFEKNKSDEAKDTDLLAHLDFSITNHNYKYINNLIYSNNIVNKKLNSRLIKKRNSFWINFIEDYIYKVKPHLIFSRLFVNTYTVAFMIIYFFTLLSWRFSTILNDLLVKCLELSYQYIYGISEYFKYKNHSFIFEFKLTCICTSILLTIQMFLSIKNFQRNLILEHRANNEFTKIINKYEFYKYKKIVKKRNQYGSIVTSDSIHFSGYLIAHLVYGYIILLSFIFLFILFIKFFYYFPNIIYSFSQVLLPIIILLTFKYVILKVMTNSLFLKSGHYRIKNSVAYHIMSYFNFFFDCFLGLLSCMSRVWLSNLISIMYLTRIDTSMFNRDSDFLIRRLDKGYLAYSNYIKMEHWYNNPIVNGFCEMLIESMIYSKLNKKNSKTKTKRIIRFDDENTENINNLNFNYKSYKRLRNLFFLLILLNKKKILKQHRYHSFENEINSEKNLEETFFENFGRLFCGPKRKGNKNEDSFMYDDDEDPYEKNFNLNMNLNKLKRSNQPNIIDFNN
jgi:hypothetical protein